jgi:hypothetical protein
MARDAQSPFSRMMLEVSSRKTYVAKHIDDFGRPLLTIPQALAAAGIYAKTYGDIFDYTRFLVCAPFAVGLICLTERDILRMSP